MRVVLAGRPANFHRCCCRLALVSSESIRLLSAEPHLHPQLALNACHGPLTTLLGWRVRHGLIPVRAIDLLRGLVSSHECCQTQIGVCTFGCTFCTLGSAVSCLCTPFCWKPLATGNAVARLTQHARPRLRFPHVAIPCQCHKNCCWPLVDVEPARNFNAPSLRNIEATEGKMRNEGGPQL